MAITVRLQHRGSGIIRTGYFGFSWTTLFFGSFPALFRGDFMTFIGSFAVYLILGICTLGIGSAIAGFVWAFFYNGYYTKRLLERGYVLADSEVVNEQARMKLGIVAAA